MTEFLYVKSIAQLHALMGAQPSNHPLIAVVDMAAFTVPTTYLGQKVVTSFYTITFKSRLFQSNSFGRIASDFEAGVLYAQAPEQVFTISEPIERGNYQGWMVCIHPDLLVDKYLFKQIKKYSFFAYQTNEALHLSNSEQTTLSILIDQLVSECNARLDTYSQSILVSYVGLLLDFVQRYYGRQFITRQTTLTGIAAKFTNCLKTHVDTEAKLAEGLPSVSYFAEKLNISPSYLSDLLKRNTGHSAQELIHSYLIRKAKELLLRNETTIAEIAYLLGFEYPAYFSRVFKNKTGITPLEFRKANSN